MPEDPVAGPSSSPPTAVPVPPSRPTGTSFNIGEEFGTAKRNLPPAKMVVPAVAAVLVVVAIAVFLQRAKPPASGSLDNVTAAELPGNTSSIVALTFTVKNFSDKLIYVHSIQGKLKTAKGEITGDAISAIDFDRFFQAFPVLKNGIQPALVPEAKIQPGESVSRSVIVTFPVALDDFNKRQSVSVVIHPYDEADVVLTK